MASSLIDVCRFNPTAGGTTDWTYSSAVTGYQSPTAAGAVNAATYSYRAESADLTQWEIGTGAYNSGTGVFARTAVLFNSSGTTSKISFSAVPQVAVVALAEDIVRGQTGHIPGEPGTGLAASGEIGETSRAAFSLSLSASASPKNLTSITVPAGDLEIIAHVQFESGGAITSSDWNSIISTTSTPSISNANSIDGLNHHTRMPSGADYSVMHAHVPYPVSNASPTIYYLHAQATYSGGTPSASGYLRYRRAR
jgi:hypothetical protein